MTPAAGEVTAALEAVDVTRSYRLEGVVVEALRGVSLRIDAGEVFGLAGLLGSGRTELARLLFGADRADSGEVRVDGRVVSLRNLRSAIAAGIAFGGLATVRGRRVLQRLEHQVRVDRRGAVADQGREVMHLARLARLEHEARLQARALAYEVVVDGGDGEQGRDGGALRAHAVQLHLDRGQSADRAGTDG